VTRTPAPGSPDGTTSGPTPRAALADVPAYVAGRPPTPREGQRSYKLSSNENPYPPLPAVVEALEKAASTVNRYPDMGSVALYEALAERLDVPTSDLAVGTGSVALLYHLVQAFCEPGDEVVFAWRSFEAYPIAAAVCGARAVTVPLTPDGRHDLPRMAAAVTDRTRIVLVCTPNNPTGPAIGQDELDAFLQSVPPEVLVVLDEAYREFVRLDDPIDAVGTYRGRPNVAVMRTFAKAYGLAGLRVGYLIAPSQVAGAVRVRAAVRGVRGRADGSGRRAGLRGRPARAGRLDRRRAGPRRRSPPRAGLDRPGPAGQLRLAGAR
jgi:histidinol-phosphate aminotransferase